MVTAVRYLFTVVNIFHIVLGLLLTLFGFWLQYASPIREVINADSTSLIVVHFAIALGFIILTLGVIGSFGDITSNKRILGVYLGLNVVILILEITALAYGYSQRNSLQAYVRTTWTAMTLTDRYIIQDRFNCCGYAGPAEYNVYPDSCLQNTTNLNSVWTIGCNSFLSLWFDQNVALLGVLVGLLLVASFFQCILGGSFFWKALKHPNAVGADELETESDEENKKISRSRPGSRISKRSYQHLT